MLYSSPQKKVSVSIRSVSILLKRNGRCVPLQRSRPFRSVPLDRKRARQFALAAGFFEFTVYTLTAESEYCTDALA